MFTAVHSVEPIVPDFRRKSFNVSFFLYFSENSSSSPLIENFYILIGFKKFYLQTLQQNVRVC